MAHIDLSSYEPVNGATNDGNPITSAFVVLQTLLNGLLDSTNISPTAGLPATALSGYPADATKVLKGDGSWAAASSDGWSSLSALTYATTDGHTFTATYSGDLTGTVPAGARVKVTDSGTQYFIVTKHVAGTLTLYGGTTYSLSGGAITNPFFSREKVPVGFNADPSVWSEQAKVTSASAKTSPASGTWYGDTGLSATGPSLAIPIGAWIVGWEADILGTFTSSGANNSTLDVFATLSTGSSTESDSELTAYALLAAVTSAGAQNLSVGAPARREKRIVLTAKTTYYLNIKTGTASMADVQLKGDKSPSVIRAVCAYL